MKLFPPGHAESVEWGKEFFTSIRAPTSVQLFSIAGARRASCAVVHASSASALKEDTFTMLVRARGRKAVKDRRIVWFGWHSGGVGIRFKRGGPTGTKKNRRRNISKVATVWERTFPAQS